MNDVIVFCYKGSYVLLSVSYNSIEAIPKINVNRQITMTSQNILSSLGQFSNFEEVLFEKHTVRKKLKKNEILLSEGDVCKSFYYILSGSFSQFRIDDIDEVIIDLHLQNEWMFNQQSLTEQTPSSTTIKAFEKAEIVELSLNSFHCLNQPRSTAI